MKGIVAGAVLCTLVFTAAAGDGFTTWPHHGQSLSTEQAPPFVSLFHPADGPVPGFRLYDGRGVRVEGTGREHRPGELRFTPDEAPLPDGDYVIVLEGGSRQWAFSVGGDHEPPRPVSVTPDPPGRGSEIVVRFDEELGDGADRPDAIRVMDVTEPDPRVVSGTAEVAPDRTSIVFTPEGWPGIPPRAEVDVEVTREVTDIHGNPARDQTVRITGAPRPDYGPEMPVPEAIFWSSRREVGLIELAPAKAPGPIMTRGEAMNASRLRVGDPKELAVDPRVSADGWGVVLGINPFQNAVVIVDAWRGGVRDFARVPKPAGLAVHPEGHTVYVSSKRTGSLYSFGSPRPGRIDAEPSRVSNVGRKPGGVAVSRDGRFVVTVSRKDGIASVHDPVSLDSLATFETDRKPEDLVILESEAGRPVLLVSCRGKGRKGGSALAFDLETGDRIARFGDLRQPGRIASRGDRAWLVQRGAKTLTEIVLGADGVPVLGRSVPGGRRPIDVTISPTQPHVLFAVNKGRSMLTVVDADRGKVLTTVRTKGAIAVATWAED